MFLSRNISVMELAVADVARAQGVTDRHVRQAVSTGALCALRRVGQTVIIDDLAAQAWGRSRARGRVWTGQVRAAALEILEHNETRRLSSSERSRLRSTLREMGVSELAHRAGGLGGWWGRYRALRDGQLRGARRMGPSSPELPRLGLVGVDPYVTFYEVDSLDEFELDNEVMLDASGELGVVEREPQSGATRALLDTYLLGSTRESSAAGAALEAMLRDV